MTTTVITLPVATHQGDFLAHYSAAGLVELNFPKTGAKTPPAPATVPAQIQTWHRQTEAALKSILTGREPAQYPPLSPSGTDFQKSVWAAMSKISLGKTKSYGEIAAAIGRPKAVRAVGGACGANPLPVLVPCHRVLAANKKIGGFSGGVEWKRRLLTTEGVPV